jgi:hypothetical protein
MLTHEEILQVAEWKDCVGERRPGFLHDHASNLHGPVSACHSADVEPGSACNTEVHEVLRFTMAFERDPETGEMRLVRR